MLERYLYLSLFAIFSILNYVSLIADKSSTRHRYHHHGKAYFEHSINFLQERLGCGRWHNDYINFHQQILNGSLPNKQLVVVNLKSGFTDNLVGKVTALYLSLLTKRAIRFVNFGNLTQSTVALESRFLDVYADQSEYPPEFLSQFSEMSNGTKLPYDFPRKFTWAFETNKTYSPLFIVNCEIASCLKNFFLTGNISGYKPDVEHLMLALNRGAAYQLVEKLDKTNSGNRADLHRLGITSGHTAYQCAFFFLFKPTHEVVRRYHKTWTRLADPAPLKIGIHIRLGDEEFAGQQSLERGRTLLQDYQNYFLCAQEIENTRRIANQTVIWYLISDSLSLRLAAHEKYGSKVFVEKVKPLHLDCKMAKIDCTNSGQNTSMVMAAGEMLAFSLVSFHIIGQKSGF
eukprot:gene33014-44169_t